MIFETISVMAVRRLLPSVRCRVHSLEGSSNLSFRCCVSMVEVDKNVIDPHARIVEFHGFVIIMNISLQCHSMAAACVDLEIHIRI